MFLYIFQESKRFFRKCTAEKKRGGMPDCFFLGKQNGGLFPDRKWKRNRNRCHFPMKKLPFRYRTEKGAKPMISKIITDSFQ